MTFQGTRVFTIIHLEKQAIHEYRINIHSLKERGPVKTDEGTQGIVTRCRGGNTWSIPCWRNVFISLFTNVAISRCVHYKVHCRLDHSIKRSVASMGNLCRGRVMLFEQLAQFSSACSNVHRSEAVVAHRGKKHRPPRAFSGIDSTI